LSPGRFKAIDAMRRRARFDASQVDEVEALFASGDLVVDACRRAVRGPARSVPLAGRPVLFALVGALAEAWPADVPRDRLVARAFEARAANESHRTRLRVELGRLRAALRPLARIEATLMRGATRSCGVTPGKGSLLGGRQHRAEGLERQRALLRREVRAEEQHREGGTGLVPAP